MTELPNLLLIPTCLLIAAITLRSSDSAIFQKSVDFARIDKQLQADIEKLFHQTLNRLAEFQMDVPAKIVLQRLKNVDGNTFNDPFLVGNSQQVTSSVYVSDEVSEWCSGVVSRSTRKYFEHKNRRIDVVFDCNQAMLFPSLRTIVRYALILMAVNAALAVLLFVLRVLKTSPEKLGAAITASSEQKWMSIDDYLLDDEECESMFLENAEKWDASKLESCYD